MMLEGSADMAIGTNEDTSQVISSREAEAVLELWAKRQAEGELRARLSVQDLAETMNLPLEDVQRMVDSVRASKSQAVLDPPTVKQARPVNKFLIGLAVVVWLAILSGVGFFAYESGFTAARRRFSPDMFAPMPPPVVPSTSIAGTPAPAAVLGTTQNVAESIPKGISVSFGGFQISGEASKSAYWASPQNAISRIVEDVAQAPPGVTGTTKPDIALINGIQQDNPDMLDGLVKFETMTVSSLRDKFELKIPIPLTSDERILRFVLPEQEKRIKILSSQAREMWKRESTVFPRP